MLTFTYLFVMTVVGVKRRSHTDSQPADVTRHLLYFIPHPVPQRAFACFTGYRLWMPATMGIVNWRTHCEVSVARLQSQT